MEGNKYTIGVVAKLLSVTPDTLRHYEKKGLISPASRNAAGYRLYDEKDVQRLRFIKHAQSWGLSLSDIKEFLVLINEDTDNCKALYNLLIEKRTLMQTKHTELAEMMRRLDNLIEKCTGGETRIEDCLIMSTLENDTEKMPRTDK